LRVVVFFDSRGVGNKSCIAGGVLMSHFKAVFVSSSERLWMFVITSRLIFQTNSKKAARASSSRSFLQKPYRLKTEMK
jgi:hypothetical protein